MESHLSSFVEKCRKIKLPVNPVCLFMIRAVEVGSMLVHLFCWKVHVIMFIFLLAAVWKYFYYSEFAMCLLFRVCLEDFKHYA